MARKPASVVNPIEQSTYRCPACGEVVDNSRMDQVRVHHQHVLDAPFPPPWFSQRANTPRLATDLIPNEPRPTTTADAFGMSAEARLRRYGH